MFGEPGPFESWNKLTGEAPWPARYGHAAAVLGDKLLVLGGYGAGGKLNDVWASADGEVWTPLPAAMVGGSRNFAALVPVAGGMLVLGGCRQSDPGTGQVCYTTELFDEESGRWLELPHVMGESRTCAAAVSLPAMAMDRMPLGRDL